MDADEYYEEESPGLLYDPEGNSHSLKNIYDFIERGYARETPSIFLK